MNILEGYLLNIFGIKDVKLLADEDMEARWACEFINKSPDVANQYIRSRLAKLETQKEKLVFLLGSKSCIENSLKEYEIIISNPNLDVHCCEWIREGLKKDSTELEGIKTQYEIALVNIRSALSYINETEKYQIALSDNKPKSTYTSSQQVLIYYYGLKSFGLEPRVDIDIAPLAKLLHLLIGKTFTECGNSDLYKKLLKAPNFKKDQQLLKDLEIVKYAFIQVGMQSVVELIDKEMIIAKAEKKNIA